MTLLCWASAGEVVEIGPWSVYLHSKYFLLKMNSQKEKLAFSCISCNSSYKSKQGFKQHYAGIPCEAPTHQCQATQERQSTQEQRQSTYEQELLIPLSNNNEVTHYTWEDTGISNLRIMLISSMNRSFIGKKYVSSLYGKGW